MKLLTSTVFFLLLVTGIFSTTLARADDSIEQAQTSAPIWIDVRSPAEYRAGHIPGDANVHFHAIGRSIAEIAPDKDSDIRLYCAVGARAYVAQQILNQMGYTKVRNMGGIERVRKLRSPSQEPSDGPS